MCPAILSRGFPSVRQSSFAKQIADAGGRVDWESLAEELCSNEEFGNRYLNLQVGLYMRMLFIQVYAGLSDVATVTYVNETVPLIQFCNLEYGQEIDEMEYLEFCDHMRTVGLHPEWVARFCEIGSETGSEEAGTGINPLNDGSCDYAYKPNARGLLEYLHEEVLDQHALDIDDKRLGIRRGKNDRDIVAAGGHDIQRLKFVVYFKCREDYNTLLTNEEQKYVTKFFRRYSPKYLYNLADRVGVDENLAKNLRIIGCWLDANGNQEATIAYYQQHFNAKIVKGNVSQVVNVYKNTGIIGLHNLSASEDAIKQGIPVYWKEFYYAMIIICRREKSLVESILKNIRKTHPELRDQIDKVLEILQYILTARLLIEDSPIHK